MKRKYHKREPKPEPAPVVIEVPESSTWNVPAPEEAPALAIPRDWIKGALLNIRNGGDCYLVTLLGEEYDVRYPHRTLKFPNSADCQNFVSRWYSRESPDPRAR